jgi:hypothetical protein
MARVPRVPERQLALHIYAMSKHVTNDPDAGHADAVHPHPHPPQSRVVAMATSLASLSSLSSPDEAETEAAVEAVSAAYAGDFTGFLRDMFTIDEAVADPAEVLARCKVVRMEHLHDGAFVVVTIHGLCHSMKYAVIVTDGVREGATSFGRCSIFGRRPILTLAMLRTLMYRDIGFPPSLVKYVYAQQPSETALATRFGIPGPFPPMKALEEDPDGTSPIFFDMLLAALLPRKATPLLEAKGGCQARRVAVRVKAIAVLHVSVDATTTFAAVIEEARRGCADGSFPSLETTVVVVYTIEDAKGCYSVRPEHWTRCVNDFVQFDVVDVECISIGDTSR